MVEGECRFQVIEDALRQFGGFVGLFDIGLDQRELVATQAGQGAEAAAVGAQAVGQGQQQLVAGLVAELLVDAFEVIQARRTTPPPGVAGGRRRPGSCPVAAAVAGGWAGR